MNFITQTPFKGLPRTYLKKDIPEGAFLRFCTPLKDFIKNLTIADKMKESEEHVKSHASTFLQDAFFKGSNLVNTYGRVDLAIYCGKDANSKIAVIVECKRDANKADMITKGDFNFKALHEAILYFLREQDDKHNDEIRRIVITDGWQWFIFDSADFLRLFSKDYTLITEYRKWKTGKKTDSGTDAFYGTVGNRLRELDNELRAIYFDLHDLKGIADEKQDKAKAVFKCLAPQYLLKEEMANDSNVLNTAFYNELLHIIGLEEKKDQGKTLIRRAAIPQPASLIENTIKTLDTEGCLVNLREKQADYGGTKDEQLFNVALELCMTWINRVIFLKLLEAQLIHYHNGNPDGYAFLSAGRIQDFDALQKLFFQVLAKKPEERDADLPDCWRNVPYLNSSLFKISRVESQTARISNLPSDGLLPVYPRTVLIDDTKRRVTGKLPTLEYLLRFLGAWSFGKESEGGIVKEEKTIINASVLGLIFEKINGYKDGSVFTPGFITEYMANATIEQAVVAKFNTVCQWQCTSLADVKNEINRQPASFIADANKTVDSLRVCDPAVGSGHFLVSALNSIIAIKSDLGILVGSDGVSLRNYSVRVENDELAISDETEGTSFHYHLRESDNKPIPVLQRVQETLFNEKRKIIENCLFGVDINPNSVNICRLRLWIELLKHSYYTKESGYTRLETLPNIDINIKCGDSLISRFDLHGLSSIAPSDRKRFAKLVGEYKEKVRWYKACPSLKPQVLDEIDKLKNEFEEFAVPGDTDYENFLEKKKQVPQLFLLGNDQQFRGMAADFAKEYTAAENKWDEKRRTLFNHAFEWRFEFPEVLNDAGDFIGFDIVIANPPFMSIESFARTGRQSYWKEHFKKTYGSRGDIYCFFYEKGLSLLREGGHLTFISSNKFQRSGYGRGLRQFLSSQRLHTLIDFCELPVFGAATDPMIVMLSKQRSTPSDSIEVMVVKSETEYRNYTLHESLISRSSRYKPNDLKPEGWSLEGVSGLALVEKLRMTGTPLGEYVNGRFYYGIKTGLNKAFVIDRATRDRLITEDANSAKLIKPWIRGKDIKRWMHEFHDLYVIIIRFGFHTELENYPAIRRHLSKFEKGLKARGQCTTSRNGASEGQHHWLELDNNPSESYVAAFDEAKLVFNETSKRLHAYLDTEGNAINKTGFIILTPDALFILAVLNSTLLDWFYRSTFPAWGDLWNAGRVQFRGNLMQQVPIPVASKADQAFLSKLAERAAEQARSGDKVNLHKTEQKIDEIVYRLFAVNPQEISQIESALANTHSTDTDDNGPEEDE